MHTVALMMKRRPVAQDLMERLKGEPGLHFCYEPDYANADVAIRSHGATVALIEAAENEEFGIDYCLALCSWLRQVDPACKLLLMCPEKETGSVEKVVQAKRDGAVDDFVFYDVSAEYLVSVLLSLM